MGFFEWFINFMSINPPDETIENGDKQIDVSPDELDRSDIFSKFSIVARPRQEEENHTIYVVSTRSFEDGRVVIDHLKEDAYVIINFNDVEHTKAQDIMNYISGAAYAIGATFEQLNGTVILAKPEISKGEK